MKKQFDPAVAFIFTHKNRETGDPTGDLISGALSAEQYEQLQKKATPNSRFYLKKSNKKTKFGDDMWFLNILPAQDKTAEF